MAVSVDLAKLDVQIRTSDVATGVTRLDAFAASADGAERSVKRLSSSSGGLVISAGRLKSVLAGLGLGLSFQSALKGVADFQTSINDLSKVSDRPLAEMQSQLMGVSSSLGSYTQLAQGYYQVLSAGVTDATASMDMLTASSMAAKAAHVTQADTIRALTSLMTGFTGQLKSAADASDLLFAIERYGKTSVQELVPVVGDLASTARIAKVAADDMGAAFAVITQTAGSTPVAATQARSLFMNIANPSETMQKALAGMGTNATEFFSSNRLMDALKKLDVEARKTGKTIGAMFTDREAKVAAENLIASAKTFEDSLAGIEGRTGAASSAFGKYADSINGQIEEMSNNMSNLATNVGSTFGGTAADGMRAFNAVLRDVNTNFSSFVPVLTSVGAGFAALAVARASSYTTFSAGDDGQRVVGLRAYIAAQYESVAATREQQAAETKLAMVRARDDIAQYKKSAGNAVNQALLRQSPAVRTAYIEGLRDLQGDLTAKTTAYEASLKTLRSTSVATESALKGLKTAGSSLLGVFGGPWGLAFTGAAAAVTYLSTQQSLAEKASDLQGRALQNLNAVMRETSAGTFELAESTREVAQAKLALAIQEQDEALKKYAASLKLMDFGSATAFLPSFREQAQSLDLFIEQARTGEESWASVQRVMSTLITELDAAGEGSSRLGERLKQAFLQVNQAAEGERNLAKMKTGAEQVAAALDSVGGSAKAATGEAAKLGGALGQLAGLADVLNDSKFAAFTAGLSGAQKTFATAMKGKLNEGQLSAYFSGKTGALSEQDTKTLQSNKAELDAIYANYKKIYTLQESTKHAGNVASAQEAIQRYREEIERLNGVQPSGVAKLAQYLRDIAKEGKQAGLSVQAVAALQAEYKSAFDDSQARKAADAMRDFDREIASLTGDSRALKELEMEAAFEQWKKKLLDAGMAAEEVTPKLGDLREALEKSNRTKDIQTTVQFYKDLAELSGDLTYSLQAQNELIALQAEEYRKNGIPEQLVAQWQALKQLQASNSGWDGATRGMLRYYSEATNAGKNFETFFTNSFSSLEDVLVQFTQTGKLSFNDMVNSMLADLARIAIRQSVTGPIAQGLSGLFSGGSYLSQAMDLVGMIPGFGAMSFHDGGMVGMSGPPVLSVPMAAYADAPRYHSGYPGFGPDEYPAVLLSGERVLNRQETADYNAGMAGGGRAFGGYAPSVVFSPVINPVVINQSGQDVGVQAKASPNGTGGFDLEVYLTQTADSGLARMAASGKSQFMQYIDKSRGTGGNARSLY